MSYWNEPELQKMKEQMKWMKFFIRFLWLFKLVNKKELMTDLKDLKKKNEEMVNDIDEFSNLLSPLWRANFGSIKSTVLQEAIDAYRKWNIKEAEETLIEEVNTKIIRYQRRISNTNVQAFCIRKDLLFLAIKDHEEGRYHASIPVLLACVDWIVNDIVPEQKGLFAEWEHTIIPNSLTWYGWWLNKTISVLSKMRRQTSTDPLDIPYRNWILHGHDINYYNKLTGTKTIALLFATYDWARDKQDFEQEKKKEPSEEKSLREVIKKHEEHRQNIEQQERARKKWTKRKAETIKHIIENNIFDENTPEKFIADNFQALQWKKYWIVAQQLGSMFIWEVSVKQYAGELRRKFENIDFISFTITSIKDESSAISEIEYNINYMQDDQNQMKHIKQRIVYEDKERNTSVRNIAWWTWKFVFKIDDLLDIY